jgi:hypothetical protein
LLSCAACQNDDSIEAFSPNGTYHLIRYYGRSSNKKRGQRAKRQPSAPESNAASPRAPSTREARKRWAALIKQVYETDPLTCAKCGEGSF